MTNLTFANFRLRRMGKDIVAFGFVMLSFAQAEELSGFDTCLAITREASLDRIQVVPSDKANEHTCSRVEPLIDFDDMMNRCEAFCGINGIPILVGTDSVGFPLVDMDRVCLGTQPVPSSGPITASILQYNPAKMAECQGGAWRSTKSTCELQISLRLCGI